MTKTTIHRGPMTPTWREFLVGRASSWRSSGLAPWTRLRMAMENGGQLSMFFIHTPIENLKER